jgi:hypothetical protein
MGGSDCAVLDGAGLPFRPSALLHTGVMRQHLLTAEGPEGTWRPSGLINFEPAMRGCSPPKAIAGS